LDPRGTAIYANQGFLDYRGLSREEIMAPTLRARVFYPDDIARVQQARADGLSRGLPFENEQRPAGKDGKYRWFLFRYKPVLDKDSHIVRWFATVTDIEDRKQAEHRMRNENLALREEIDRSSMYEAIVGSSAALSRVLAQLEKVAPTDPTVLISGETGTGKELIANAIHKRSMRAAKARPRQSSHQHGRVHS
jgi:formate hydrogenlyase transcriptional activator